MNLYDAITNRVSTRKYSEKQLSQEALQQIKENLKTLEVLDSDIHVRLELLSEPDAVKQTGIGFLGGHLRINAPYCIVGITEKKQGCMENMGFILEQAVLNFQKEDIATCWLGTFNETALNALCGVKENEKAVIVIAFGYAEKGGFYNNGMRKLIKASNRKELTETCFYKTWGNTIDSFLSKEPEMKKRLYLSSRYPSSNNSQPVRVIAEDGRILVFAKVNKNSESYKLDSGIFMAHFYLVCQEEGLRPSIWLDQIDEKPYNVPNDYQFIGAVNY